MVHALSNASKLTTSLVGTDEAYETVVRAPSGKAVPDGSSVALTSGYWSLRSERPSSSTASLKRPLCLVVDWRSKNCRSPDVQALSVAAIRSV